MSIKLLFLMIGLMVALSGGANASTIDYIFTGTGTGTLNGTAFDGDFTVTYIGDPANVTLGSIDSNLTTSGTFSTSSLNADFDSQTRVDLNTDPSFLGVGFGQIQSSSPFFVEEVTRSPAYAGYNLTTAFPLTSGTVSAIPQTYLTDNGNLTFDSISSLSFQATLNPTPLPPALPLFAAALAGLGLFGYQRRRARG